MSSNSKQATIVEAGKGRKLNVLGHTVNVVLGSRESQGDSFVFEAISPAGLVVPPHIHENEDEYGYIAEGVYEIYLDGRTYEATAGAFLYFPRHSAHGFRNIGSTTGKMIWISTPGASVERFFDELGALPADAPPDLQKVAGIFTKYNMQVLPPPEK
ncbi:MAG: cupin domain-containing protein [Caldilineaceae bacterium]|nr:cupin domain-containing protein [Caldilineaceae bacterium]